MIKKAIILLIICISFCQCKEAILGSDPPSTPAENFESLWNTIDQRYSFFSYKNIDWDKVYIKYKPRIKPNMTDLQLFSVLFEMLGELRDAHVNLVAPFNVSRYEGIFSKSPENFDNALIMNHYLGKDYYTTGSFKHQFIASGQIGYVRYESFSNEVSESDIDFIIDRYKNSSGIIFDVRNNGGGFVSGVMKISSRFASERCHVYTSYLKSGPGHEDFSSPNEVYIGPVSNSFTQKVCVLTNRGCYSATSFFVLAMRNFPSVTIVGDTTGGGLGAPAGAELPNGWGYRFSASKTISPEGFNYEDGIPPDVMVNMRNTDINKGIDTIIEKATALILSKN